MTIWTAVYWDDWLGDTQDLSLLEHGAYFRLVAAYYASEGRLSAERKRLYRICGAVEKAERQAVEDVVSRYFGQDQEGWLSHDRCDHELERASRKSESARKAAAARWHSDGNATAYADAEQPQCSPQGQGQGEPEPESHPTVSPSARAPAGSENVAVTNGHGKHFDAFWALYPRRRDKKKAREVWIRKRLDEHAATICDDLRLRPQCDQQWKDGYIPLPTTYLRGDRWNDEYASAEQRPAPTGMAGTAKRFGDRLRARAAERGEGLHEKDYTEGSTSDNELPAFLSNGGRQ